MYIKDIPHTLYCRKSLRQKSSNSLYKKKMNNRSMQIAEEWRTVPYISSATPSARIRNATHHS